MAVWEQVLAEVRAMRGELARLSAAIEMLAGARAAGAAPGDAGAPAASAPPPPGAPGE